MKIVINITESYYNACKRLQKQGIAQVAEAIIANGKPYEERPKGEWIEEDSETGALGIKYTWFKCNQCNWSNSLAIPKNFCPNCGADMRGGRQ